MRKLKRIVLAAVMLLAAVAVPASAKLEKMYENNLGTLYLNTSSIKMRRDKSGSNYIVVWIKTVNKKPYFEQIGRKKVKVDTNATFLAFDPNASRGQVIARNLFLRGKKVKNFNFPFSLKRYEKLPRYSDMDLLHDQVVLTYYEKRNPARANHLKKSMQKKWKPAFEKTQKQSERNAKKK